MTDPACENCGKSWERQNTEGIHWTVETHYGYHITFCNDCVDPARGFPNVRWGWKT